MTWNAIWAVLREEAKELWLMVWLVVWTVWDLRYRKICLWQILLVVGAGFLWQWIDGSLFTGTVWGGLLLGVTAWGFSLLTEDRFGRGEAMVILCLGLYLGFSRSLSTLLWGLLAASAVSLYLLLVRKKSVRQSIPFIPCLAAGYLLLGITLAAG